LSILPDTIEYLTLGNSFNQEINCIPANYKHLTLGKSFDKPIHIIPEGVTHLIFGGNFNRQIKGRIPSTVTHRAQPNKIKHLTLDPNTLGIHTIYKL
jgi:hypothetical protein